MNGQAIKSALKVMITSIMLSFSATLTMMTLLYGHPSGFSSNEVLLLGISILIPTIVSFPVAFYVFVQHGKLKDLTAELSFLIRYDPLTSLLSRRAFFKEIEGFFAQPRRVAHPHAAPSAQHPVNPHAIFFIDLDHFKKINDVHGHGIGDEVLQLFGAVLRQEMAPQDIAGRLGGEEFCLFIPHCCADMARARAYRILAQFQEQAYTVGGRTVAATLSIGVSFFARAEELDHHLNRADAMLYLAKGRGRNTVVLDGDDAAPAAGSGHSSQAA
jgi:diguanylate cyclase (GGDEF)-like protein